MKHKYARIRNVIVSMILTLGLLSYATLTFLPIQTLSTKVSANGLSPVPEMEGNVYAITASGKLINFNIITPGAINSTVTITGLQSGETIVGIDFRPRTGQLFALSGASRLYTINTMTGVATQVGTAAFTPALSGAAFGFDFNPVPDRIRVVSDTEQNLRLNPDTGAAVMADTPLTFATGDPNAAANPSVVAAAYTNNTSGASTTTLFGIDSTLGILVRQGSPGGAPDSPNNGVLTTIGSLGVMTTNQVGFDIAAPGDVALASLTAQSATTSSLYSINLGTGAATLVGSIGGGEIISDIAVVTRVDAVFALTASNRLISFNSGTPGALISSRTITGLQPGENLLGLDFRPATGQLFSISDASRVYTINSMTGVATPVGGAPISTPLNGTSFGFDFNPAVDRIRLVSDARQNLRLNPNDGTLAASDMTLAYAAGDMNVNATPNVVAEA
ncbi:MAG: DUF4394 domain-containing protein, partial [Acidobacteria bacterium]|nr:DUF4394 domain-containing protein [Acidobacteriota bacterium]